VIIATLLLLIFVVWLRISPPYIVHQRALVIDAKTPEVFAIISDIEKQPSWRHELKKIEFYESQNKWSELYKNGVEILVHEERKQDWILGTSLYSIGKFAGFREIICLNLNDKTKVLITETICSGRNNMWQIRNILSPNGEHLDNYLRDLKTAITR
jgi:hypothetical protein